MAEQDEPLSLVLFSGTDDKLTAASVLAVGAAAMGRPLNIFLQYYALDAFRAGRLHDDHKLSPEATDDQAPAIKAHAGQVMNRGGDQHLKLSKMNFAATSLPARPKPWPTPRRDHPFHLSGRKLGLSPAAAIPPGTHF